jgi:hypothetical protein
MGKPGPPAKGVYNVFHALKRPEMLGIYEADALA